MADLIIAGKRLGGGIKLGDVISRPTVDSLEYNLINPVLAWPTNHTVKSVHATAGWLADT